MIGKTKSLITLLFCLMAFSGYAQLEKLEYAIEDKNYKRALKVAEDFMENRDLRKYPETYFYHALALYELSKDELWYEKNPDAIKEAVKSAAKGMKKDEDENVTEAFRDLIDNVAEAQNQIALDNYNINKLTRAVSEFDKSYELNQNLFAYYMSAKSSIEYGDTITGEPKYEQLITWYEEDSTIEKKELEPYIYFIDKYWAAKKYNQAKQKVKEARAMLGNNAKLSFYQKEITLEQIKNMPPSALMLEYIQDALQYDLTDEDLLHQENAVYIYLLKNRINGDNPSIADSTIQQFVAEKVAKSKLKEVKQIAEIDVFVQDKPENVLWKLAEYFQTYNHINAAKNILDRYIATTAKDTTEAAIAERWGIIAEYAYQTKPLAFSTFILSEAIAKYPENTSLLGLRSKIVKDKEYVRLDDLEAGAVYALLKDIYEVDKTEDNLKRLVDLNDKYVGLLIASNRFSTAYEIMDEQMALMPDKDHSARLEFIAQEDFYQNYFLTKTKGKNASGEMVNLFEWNGSVSGCNEGEVDQDIQEKVANRINYFRRNAGVPEVLFDAATNEYCQKAALMMTANRDLQRDPPRSWRCWSDEGVYAAKHSLLIKDANTSLAVTYIMDDKNPTAGNRRWLLYPNGRVYGHGSTDDVAVIWALDDSGSTDTMAYMDNPVCWPPDGYVPQLMLLENWTFSIYRNLKDAQVEVKQDGNPLEVEVEEFVDGYGAPTLVFKPKFNKRALPLKSDFEVLVTLSDGRKYNYTVHSFSYNPAD
jgi:hypothetical protein